MALVLTRRDGEWVRIGDAIRVQVVEIDRGRCRLRIEAPRDVEIVREEILPQPTAAVAEKPR